MFAASRSSVARLPAARMASHCRAAAFSGVASGDGAAPSSPSEDPPRPPPDADPASTRRRALSLYRKLLRGAEGMPTPNRRNYVKRKTRDEFRRHRALTDAEEIDFQLRLADTNLDTVLVQAEHLSRLFNDPEYQNYN